MVRVRYHRLDMAVAAETGVLRFQPVEGYEEPAEDTLYQLSRLESLTHLLEYEGLISVIALKQYGDFGVGAPYLLGELNVLDGEVYQALYDGTVIVSNPHQTVPFAQLTHFKVDFSHCLSSALDIRDFESQLDHLIAPHGRDIFYAVKIRGWFPMMQCRSVYFQQKPFKSMERIMAEDQIISVWHDVAGTLISIYGPGFIHPLAPVGWHFHFLSDDRKSGGHVLNLQTGKVMAEFNRISLFVLMIPER